LKIRNLNIFGKNKKVLFKKGTAGKPAIIFFHGFPDNYFVWNEVSKDIDSSFFQVGINLEDLANVPIGEAKLLFLSVLKKLDLNLGNGLYFIGHDIGGPVMSYFSEVVGQDLKGSIFLNSLDLATYKKNIISRQILKSWYALLFQIKPYRWAIKNNLLFAQRIFKKIAKGHEGEISFKTIDFYHTFFNSLFINDDIPCLKSPTLYILSKDDPFIKIPSKNKVMGELTIIRGGHWDQFMRDSMAVRLINKKLNSWEMSHA